MFKKLIYKLFFSIPIIKRLKDENKLIKDKISQLTSTPIHEINTTLHKLENKILSLESKINIISGERADFIIPFWYEWNFHEPNVQHALIDLCKPADTVFDVGANAGALSLLMSRLVGIKGVVYSFEASRRIVDKTAYNLAVNGCGNIQLMHNAVYKNSGEVIEVFEGRDLNDSIIMHEWDKGHSGMKVSTIALDDFVEKWKAVPTVVKMDIEGAEFDAVLGFQKTIETHKPHLILEQNCDDTKCFEFLMNKGYKAIDLSIYELVDSNEKFKSLSSVANVLFIHESKIADTPYSNLKKILLKKIQGKGEKGIELSPGRYIFELKMSASNSDNEIMMGIKNENGKIFNYHSNTNFLCQCYKYWVINLENQSHVTPFFEFLNNTYDPTFKVEEIIIFKLQSF